MSKASRFAETINNLKNILLFAENKFSKRTHQLNSFLFVFIVIGYIAYLATLFTPLSSCLEYPVWKHDYGFYYPNVKNATAIAQSNFRPSWYNPDISAGRVEVAAPGSRLIMIPSLLLPMVPPHITYNVTIFLCLLSLPFIFAYALSLVGFRKRQQMSGFALYSLVVVGSSMGHEYLNFGHFGFMFSSTLSFVAAAFLYKYLHEKKLKYLLLQATCAGIVLWSHALACIPLFYLHLMALAAGYKYIRIKDCIYFLASFCVLTIGPNFFWTWHFIVSLVLTELGNNEHTRYLQTFGGSYFLRFDFIFLTLCGCALAVVIQKRKQLGLYFGIFSTFLLLAFYGSQLGLHNIEPARYQFPSILAFILLTTFLKEFYQLLLRLTFICATVYMLINPIWVENESMGCGFDSKKNFKDIFSFIQSNLNHKGRLLIQDSWDNSHCVLRYLSLIPPQTNVPILSEPFVSTAYFSQFVDDEIFRHKIDTIDPEKLNYYLRLYNVSHLLIFSPNAKKFILAQKNMELIYKNDPFMIFKIKDMNASYCIDCDADITFEMNRINIKNSHNPVTTLKFHYSPLLSVIPKSLSITPVCIGEDDRAFMQVTNGNINNFSIVMNNSFFNIRNDDKICPRTNE